MTVDHYIDFQLYKYVIEYKEIVNSSEEYILKILVKRLLSVMSLPAIVWYFVY